jgi:hypothetical protein
MKSNLGRLLFNLAGHVLSGGTVLIERVESLPGGITQCDLLRDIIPFRPVTILPEWRTSTVLALATGIYEEKAFDRMPILADALQDSGCSNEDILNHCRSETVHTRGCWALDLVLGKH